MPGQSQQSQSIPNINPWLVAIAVMSGTFMEVLDTTVVDVSPPHIALKFPADSTKGRASAWQSMPEACSPQHEIRVLRMFLDVFEDNRTDHIHLDLVLSCPAQRGFN
jgi:hypothetical protein